MTEFTERSDIESGFAAVFAERIAPSLVELDEERRALLAKAKRHAAIALAAGIVLGLIFVLFGSGSSGMGGVLVGLGIPTAFGAVAAVLLWKRQAKKWSGSAAAAIMPQICTFLGDHDYDKEALKGFALNRMQKLGVIPPFTKSKISDRLEGIYRDTQFEIVEGELISKKRQSSTNSDNNSNDRSSETVFKGLLLRIGVPEPIPARILIARDYGMGNKLAEFLGGGTGRNMPKVDTGHAEFEDRYEVYSDNPDAARKVLAPGFLDSLVTLAEAEGGRHGAEGIEAGFHEDSFFVALKRNEGFLNMGSLTTPVDEIEEELHGVFDDIATTRRIIDRLHGDHPA